MMLKTPIALAATALALLSAPAQAAFITGSITFADGLDNFGTTTSIVSLLTTIDDDPATPEAVSDCTLSFGAGCAPTSASAASDFVLGVPNQVAYTYNGFTFEIDGFGPIIRVPLTCAAGGCSDFLLFTAFGTVSGNGFDPTGFTMSFSASGNCTQATSGATECGAQVTAGWDANITATGGPPRLVPEPGTLALMGIALAGLGFQRRRA